MRKPASKPKTGKASAVQAAGQCVCGAVKFEIDVPAVWAWHDHSAASRRAHGSAYVTYVGSWRSRFRLLEGQSSISRYEDADAGTTRSFCTGCGTPLFYERPRAPKIVNIPRPLFAGRTGREPRYHLALGETAGLGLSGRAAGAPEGLSRRDVGAAEAEEAPRDRSPGLRSA